MTMALAAPSLSACSACSASLPSSRGAPQVGNRPSFRGSVWGQKLKAGKHNVGYYPVKKLTTRAPVAIIEDERTELAPPTAGLTSLGTDEELAQRILSGEFSVESSRDDLFSKIRQAIARAGPVGRSLALSLAKIERDMRTEKAKKLPEATGDVSKIVGQPFFVPLFALFQIYGGIFRLSFGPKTFVIVSDDVIAKRILKDNAKAYSKGILAEILGFVMGTGLIPADGEVWKTRRRAIVPSLHRKYVTAMLSLFGKCAVDLCDKLYTAANNGEAVEMEGLFSRMTLDVIGKAVFNYEFNSLQVDTGIVEAVYVALREAEARSTAFIPYWNVPILAAIDPRQRKVAQALKLINDTLDVLIAKCKEIVKEEDIDFGEEYISERDPSILHFLLAAGDEVTSKQLRDDLMTMLIAGHETSAAVLTWTFYLLALNPTVTAKIQMEVDAVLGDRAPTIEDMKKLRYTTNVINESMRLYPQPPVLIRRSLEDDMLGKYFIKKGEDIFISTWNLHRSPKLWEESDEFRPDRWDSYSAAEASQDFRFLPFGGGPRKCVGDVFATFETVTALAMIVRRFDFEMAPDAPPVTMTTGATIHTSDGLHMVVTRRTKVPIIPVTDTPASDSLSLVP
ncbi:unnamed protein product [Calypogeia fissa]